MIDAMSNRERFRATMHYQPRDRAPICDFGFWREVWDVWYDQGLPRWVNKTNSDLYFGMDYGFDAPVKATGIEIGLVPPFDEVVLEDRGDQELVQQFDGVQVLRRKVGSSIPMPVGHRLVDRDSWRKYYVPRLDPAHPDRYPPDFDERVKEWADPNRDSVIALPGGKYCGGLYGWLRNWMGVEKLSLVVYDDPAWFEEMVTTVADCIIGVLSRVLATGGHFDACPLWEDMCYNAGPLLSPQHFKRYLVPHYRRISDLVRKHGVDVIWVDCDGKIDSLMPLWLDAGVNCMFPMEIGTWGADPVRYRKEYGRDLLMLGGFDKHILARSKREIEQEVHRLAPLMEEGGYIGYCDHRVPPNVSLENYRFYVETVRRVWGKDLNLRAMDCDGSKASWDRDSSDAKRWKGGAA